MFAVWPDGCGFASATFLANAIRVFRKHADSAAGVSEMSAIRRRRVIKRARSLSDAMDMCMEHAQRKHQRPLKRVADLMGTPYATVHDWLSKGSLPANKIAPFEFACGATYVTEWICANAHLLAVEMPSGRALKETDVLSLNQHFLEATALLIGFFKGESGQDETIAELDALMGELGWHRANVERAACPELELFGEME